MLSRMKGQKGFTLIELMIVVAIIGILAAIAIPNFLQYQMKARQTEARTNTMGIKTGMVSYSGTNGCFPGMAALPALAPTPAKQPWGAPVPFVPTAGLCDPILAVYLGAFGDIGFVPSGNVYYQYVVQSELLAATLPLRATIGAGAGANACVAIAAIPAPGGAAGNAGFQAVALGNLDGDGFFSNFSSDDATGATDCTPGIF